MDWGNGFGFLVASVLVTLMPGPDILFVAAQSAAGGRRSGSAVALGLCTGLLVHIAAAALGVSAVVYRSHAAFLLVKVLGATYLFYLAWQAWRSSRPRGDGASFSGKDREEREREQSPEQGSEPEQGPLQDARGGSRDAGKSFGQLYRRGILMNLLNPKVSLFFVAFLPQFVVTGGWAVPLQMALLGATFLAQALILFHGVAFAAGKLGKLWAAGGESASRRTARIQAVIYALLGAQLLLQHWL